MVVAWLRRPSQHHGLARTTRCLTSELDLPPAGLRGYVLPVRITMPSSDPLLVIRLYVPSDDDAKAAEVYSYCSRLLNQSRARGTAAILVGDLNATAALSDRTSGTTFTRDTLFRAFMREQDLSRAAGPPYTYASEDGETRSAIDHVLANPAAASSFTNVQSASDLYAGDHTPLFSELDLRRLRMTVPSLGATPPRDLLPKLSKLPSPTQPDAFRAEVT
jgi:exonuclease III